MTRITKEMLKKMKEKVHNLYYERIAENLKRESFLFFNYRNMMVLRVHGDDLVFTSSLHQVPHRIPQMNMMKVHIPFTFKLVETSKSSYAGKYPLLIN